MFMRSCHGVLLLTVFSVAAVFSCCLFAGDDSEKTGELNIEGEFVQSSRCLTAKPPGCKSQGTGKDLTLAAGEYSIVSVELSNGYQFGIWNDFGGAEKLTISPAVDTI